MGGDRLVTEVAGQRTEDALGDQVRALHDEHYDELFGSVRPLPGADDLLALLRKEGFTVVMASSGTAAQTERAMELLAADDVATARGQQRRGGREQARAGPRRGRSSAPGRRAR